jgi:hypothetical protein
MSNYTAKQKPVHFLFSRTIYFFIFCFFYKKLTFGYYGSIFRCNRMQQKMLQFLERQTVFLYIIFWLFLECGFRSADLRIG